MIMISAEQELIVSKKFAVMKSELDERGRRLWAAVESMALGRGGAPVLARVTGLSRSTIQRGVAELKRRPPGSEPLPDSEEPRRIRGVGAGRKRREAQDSGLVKDLEGLVDPVTRGDPESPLRWTSKSTRKLARELNAIGHTVSHQTVARLLKDSGYSLQATRKTDEGSKHPDRNAQFEHLYKKVTEFQERGQPVISVDTKKKEMVGSFKNGGREYQPKGNPEDVNVYDFPSLAKGKAIPYGVYDVTKNEGWVSVGTDHDTSEFAVETIRRWWYSMGKPNYQDANELLITADGGGSNGSRVRLWKVALQELVDEIGLSITVAHFPPGTSKWNKIEHRMFSFISQNWRGRPLTSHEVIVNLIANTTTDSGLEIRAELDSGEYPKGIKITKKEMAGLNIVRDEFHGAWNYSVHPRRP